MDMVHFERKDFNNKSKREKKDFIDNLLEKGIRLNKDETVAATKAQKKCYINVLIAQIKELERHEIEAATHSQMEKYIEKKRWVSIAEFGQLPFNLKKLYIDVVLSKKTGLSDAEFDAAPHKLKKYYCNKTLELGREMGPKMFSFLSKKDQCTYIDMTLADGRKLTIEYEIFMKVPAKLHYKKAVQAHPFIWETQIRNQIRKILLEAGKKNTLAGS